MSRLHKVTHPVLGVVTWKEIQRARDRIRYEAGDRVCSWCHGPVAVGRRFYCGKPECEKMVRRAQDWAYCRYLILFAGGKYFAPCALCGGPAFQVDHIVPVSLGGTGDAENLRALCERCHKEESARLARAKRAYVARVSRGALYG